jgi:putative copper resistance protein D
VRRPLAFLALGTVVLGPLAAAALLGPLAAVVLAHGEEALPPPTVGAFLFGWSFDPLVWLPVIGAALLYLVAVRRVDAAHPASPVPVRHVGAFLGGLAAILVALQSGIERYDTVLFSVHMVQHILLILVAAPLIALGAPITLLLRAARPPLRARLVLPVLHSRLVRVLSFPVVAWSAFAGLMWASHFSPLFDLALEDPLVHQTEHVLFMAAGLLFWWPAVGLDPSPWRMTHPVRVLYVFLQMPQGTFLSLAILSASAPLYPHYATLSLPWLPDALADQGVAGGIMWLVGDLVFLAAILAIIAGWVRREEHETARADARADAARATIREREALLAERLAEERGAE